jgi:hypothetical protein
MPVLWYRRILTSCAGVVKLNVLNSFDSPVLKFTKVIVTESILDRQICTKNYFYLYTRALLCLSRMLNLATVF